MTNRIKRHTSFRKKLKLSVSRNKSTTFIVLTYIGTIIMGNFANILTEFNSILSIPYELISGWTYKENWEPWLHFNLMFWPKEMAG